MAEPIARKFGICPVCEKNTAFNVWGASFRDAYLCNACGCNPRQRSVNYVLDKLFPNWRSLRIHESSPGDTQLSHKLAKECAQYVPTQYVPSMEFGKTHQDGWRNENLESQTFDDEVFDIVITQDVFEHIFNPDLAIREIARTLKPGGAHICTVPLVMQAEASRRRASLTSDGIVAHIHAPDYHWNPVDENGSLVTVDWGFDIATYFDKHAEVLSTIIFANNISDYGIEGVLTEVIVSRKVSAPTI